MIDRRKDLILWTLKKIGRYTWHRFIGKKAKVRRKNKSLIKRLKQLS